MSTFSKWSIRIFVLHCLLVIHIGTILTHPAINSDKSDNLLSELDVSIYWFVFI